MKDSLQGRCKLFIENKDAIQSALRWENAFLYPLAASIYTSKNQMVDIEKLHFCCELIKKKTGLFSGFRGIAKLAIASSLALSDNPEEKLEDMIQIYERLKQEFFSSSYLPAVCVLLSDCRKETEDMIKKTKLIYDLMKKEHPFLTSAEDSPFAALIAISDLSPEDALQEMESCYQILRPYFFFGNSVQSLSHILALSNLSAKEKCDRTLQFFEQLKSRGCRYGTGYELATLGILALFDSPEQLFLDDICSVETYLSKQRGFGFFGVGSKQRLMYAGILAMSDEIETLSSGMAIRTAAMNSVISIVVAEQIALCTATAASITAAKASQNPS